MEAEIQKIDTGFKNKFQKFLKPTPKNILAASLIAFTLLMIIVSICFFNLILKKDTIYKGIYINNLYVGNMSSKHAKSLLVKNYQNSVSKKTITLKYKNESVSFKISDVEASYQITDAIKEAYSIGRTGNVFEKLYDIFNCALHNKNIKIQVDFDKQKVDDIVDSLYSNTMISVTGADMNFGDQSVTIHSGHHGESLDKTYALNGIENLINKCKNGLIQAPTVKTPPQELDVEDLSKKINITVQDAVLKVEKNKVVITPEVMGRNVDMTQLENAVTTLNTKEDTDVVLPLAFVYPKVTEESLNATLFKDNLYTYFTQFNQNTENNRNRAVNMHIAISKINNLILAPGQVFSLNEVVGDRTPSQGYLEAITYENGKLVKGIGGGLCQVVTTLYNAVLRSDLHVLQRINHSFIVTYVPLGMDATVSYNSVDFKFENSTKMPIKITCWITKDNKLYFSLTGTNENPGKTVEISSKIIKKTPFKTVYVDDPTLPFGKINPVPKQEGHTGYLVDTFKIIKQDGKIVSNTKMYTSSYRMLDEELLRGTKKAASKPSVTPKVQKAIPTAASITGVDDAENPPSTDTTPKPAESPAPVE